MLELVKGLRVPRYEGKSVQEILVAHRAARKEKAMSERGQAIAAEYGLEPTDHETILAIMDAIDAAAVCVDCQGTCLRGHHAYQQPQVASDPWRVSWTECPVRAEMRVRAQSRRLLPNRYAEKSFEDYERTADNERAVGMAYEFLSRGKGGLYLHGGFGTGKTFLATLIGQEYLRGGGSVEFGDVPSLLDRIKQTFSEKSNYVETKETGQQVLSRYIDSDLLIMDDIGTGYLTPWNVGILYQIINGRYNEQKPLVLTSNYSLEELEEKLGKQDKVAAGRITSRLRQMCKFASLGNKDRRKS